VVDQFASLWARCSPTDGRSRWLFVSPAVLLRLRSGFDYVERHRVVWFGSSQATSQSPNLQDDVALEAEIDTAHFNFHGAFPVVFRSLRRLHVKYQHEEK
jgi:hypothetical protein